MEDLLYEPYSIAYFFVSRDIGIHEQMEIMDVIFKNESGRLAQDYRTDKKRFFSDVMSRSDYLADKDDLNAEFPLVERDFRLAGSQFETDKIARDYSDLNLFFKLSRLRLLYGREAYIRIKLRTLLKHYGYKRRSEKITSHICECLDFYQLQTHLRGGADCDIRTISIDDMITFTLE